MSWDASENFRPGDIIRIEYKNEDVPYAVETQVVATDAGSHVVYEPGKGRNTMKFVSAVENNVNCTVTIVKRADTPLPTKGGLYASSENTWANVYRYYRDGDTWSRASGQGTVSKEEIQGIHNERPLHRLVVSD